MSWDGIFADHALRCAEIDFSWELDSVRRDFRVRLANLESERLSLQDRYCKTVAVLGAAMISIERMDPHHPFLSASWRQELGGVALSRFNTTEMLWEDVFQMGKDYPLPPREPSVPSPPSTSEITRLTEEITMLRTRLGRAHSDIVDHMSQRAAFKAELTRLDANNPLVTNVELRQRICAAGQKTFLATRGDWRMVEEVAARFREGMAIVDPVSGQGTET